MDNTPSKARRPEQAAAILRQRGISPTHQRIWVLKYLLTHPGHPSAEEMFDAARDADPPLSKASVYNILHLFEENGMLKTVQIDGACLRYDILVQEHGHFQCDACGRIYNFSAAIDDAATQGLEGFRVRQRDVYFRGLCADCKTHAAPDTAIS